MPLGVPSFPPFHLKRNEWMKKRKRERQMDVPLPEVRAFAGLFGREEDRPVPLAIVGIGKWPDGGVYKPEKHFQIFTFLFYCLFLFKG
jgi:hypothetical protein